MPCAAHGPACRGHASEPQEERAVLEVDEWRRVVERADDAEARAVLMLAYDLALRASEVQKVRCRDVDWRGKTIRCRRSKKGKVHLLGVADRTLDVLRPYATDGGGAIFGKWTPRRVMAAYRKAAAKAGLPVGGTRGRGFSSEKGYSHIIRRSRATHLIEAGAQLRDVQYRLGHKSAKTTLLYVGLTGARRREVDQLARALIDG